MVRNPFHPEQVTRYRIAPDVVELIGFCTKNPAPMLPYLEELKNYGQYWFVTITPYGKDLEPGVPPVEEVIRSFQKLSNQLGTDSVGWRYDPILLDENWTVERHVQTFEEIASRLAGYTKTCVISFLTVYEKVLRNFPEGNPPGKEERLRLGRTLIEIAGKYGMTLKPCGCGKDLAAYGADCSGCMTETVLEKALHCRLKVPGMKPARESCACILTADIGAYNTCGHFCRYCYANTDREAVRQNMKQHDPESPFLIGHSCPEDIVHEAKQESWKDQQFSLGDYMDFTEKTEPAPGSAEIVLQNQPGGTGYRYRETPLGRQEQNGSDAEKGPAGNPETGRRMPPEIRKMMEAYEFGDGSFRQKCKNFVRQGNLMAEYEDDAPWAGTCVQYFPTYHDLNLKQLRGYFTWRTGVRRGEYRPAPATFAYLYLYELLNQIGVSSPEDSLTKMDIFEKGFLDSGVGDQGIRRNLRRWEREFAILHDGDLAKRRTEEPEQAQKELLVLKEPEKYSDQEVTEALLNRAGGKLRESPVLQGEEGEKLFARAWRIAAGECFSKIFGEKKAYPWHPLSNAVYWEETPHPDCEIILNACETIHCREGKWIVDRYDRLSFRKDLLQQFLHEADRIFRKKQKTGRYLRKKPEESWADAYILEALRKPEKEIRIDLTGLEKIREDADVTRDSLLTEEELEAEKEEKTEDTLRKKEAEKAAKSPEPAESSVESGQRQLLRLLLAGEPVDTFLKSHHLIPSVVTDEINAEFYEELGDNVLSCDGRTISLVEDYREDIEKAAGESHE